MVDGNIIYQARLHWILFFWPVTLLCLAVMLGLQFPMLYHAIQLVFLLVLLWGGIIWMNYHFSYVTIKKKQVVLRTGILVRQTVDIPLNKIESIDIRQSILGSLLHYGSLVITGTGGSRQLVNHLSKPLTCRRYIEQLMHQ